MIRLCSLLGCGLLGAAVVAAENVPGASATLKDAKGQTIGNVTLTQATNGVLVRVDLRNVAPGVKAFHIHETGRCDAPTFESAGSHFAAKQQQHGLLNASGPHAGDLPNIHVPEGGAVSVELLAPGLTLDAKGGAALFDANGAAAVLHAGADDYRSNPAGDAGARLACGVLTR